MLEALCQQLVGGRAMVPHGDRSDAAQSSRVKGEVELARMRDDIVRVLVLHDDVDDRQPAVEHVLERLELRDPRERRHALRRDVTAGAQRPRGP